MNNNSSLTNTIKIRLYVNKDKKWLEISRDSTYSLLITEFSRRFGNSDNDKVLKYVKNEKGYERSIETINSEESFKKFLKGLNENSHINQVRPPRLYFVHKDEKIRIRRRTPTPVLCLVKLPVKNDNGKSKSPRSLKGDKTTTGKSNIVDIDYVLPGKWQMGK